MSESSQSSPFHACCIAAPRSGEGKTTVTLALMRAFRNRGLFVQGFKCGPDYIDPSFHRQASGHESINLDTWMMGQQGVINTWRHYIAQADMAVCEGVMGLFDSREPGNIEGSTADCAATLNIPVVLVVQTRGMAGSIAALVAGFRNFLPRLKLAGIIANGVGSARHVDILSQALEREGLPPLLGSLPFQNKQSLPERQLGLVPAEECQELEPWFEAMGQLAEDRFDLKRLFELSQCPRPTDSSPSPTITLRPCLKRLGIARDKAFRFYYEENLRFLKAQGWELVPFSPLENSELPQNLDSLYIGGGYPEEFAPQLASNVSMRQSIFQFAQSGHMIYAECGGYMYLGKNLIVQDKKFPMCGVINGTCTMGQKLRSLGYREVEWQPHRFPWRPDVQRLRGHEFHWSNMELHETLPPLYSYRDRQGNWHQEGIYSGNVMAGYIHLFWACLPESPDQLRSRYSGRVLLLNGASSSGKTSLAYALRNICPGPVMVFSIDHFLPLCGNISQSVSQAVDQTKLPLIETFHASVAEAARAGVFAIVDHVIGENPAWLIDLVSRLGSIPLKIVKVTCQQKLLLNRELSREDRPVNPEHALRQFQTIHNNMHYDCEVDTTYASPEQLATEILDTLGLDPTFLPQAQRNCHP